jgi:hypothetical protein
MNFLTFKISIIYARTALRKYSAGQPVLTGNRRSKMCYFVTQALTKSLISMNRNSMIQFVYYPEYGQKLNGKNRS